MEAAPRSRRASVICCSSAGGQLRNKGHAEETDEPFFTVDNPHTLFDGNAAVPSVVEGTNHYCQHLNRGDVPHEFPREPMARLQILGSVV